MQGGDVGELIANSAARLTWQNGNGVDASVVVATTDALQLASGTTVQRPTSPVNGMIRYNSTLNLVEIYENGSWEQINTTGLGYLLDSNNLSDLTNAGTARTNLGLTAGGAGDIWVEKAGDTMTGDLIMSGAEIRNSNGTAAAPSFTFNSDPNTGMYRIGADRVGISTGGTLRAQFNTQDFVLQSGTDLYLTNNAIIFNDANGVNTEHSVGTNIDHIWHDDTTNTFNFVSDSTYKTAGNAILASTATSARYADLAEKYEADAQYPEGTVLVIGGDKEVTTTDRKANASVAGIVSLKPAYMMNNTEENKDWPFIALAGRVPCRVVGKIKKGDRLGTSYTPGCACSLESVARTPIEPGTVIGIAMQSYDSDNEGVIEVMVRSA